MSLQPNDYETYGLILIVISKNEIDTFDTGGILSSLSDICENSISNGNKIRLSITGYETDERELYEIEEIRRFIQFIDKSFPYWFYFVDRGQPLRENSLTFIMNCVCEIEKNVILSNGRYIVLNEDSFKAFMRIHFYYLNELTNRYKLTIEENYRISQEIIRLFS